MVQSLIGKGPRFPMVPNNIKGVSMNEYLDRINQSLLILLSTNKGTRLMNPGWGSDLEKFRFDPLDNVLLDKIEYSIRESIRLWEPRITVTNLEFNLDSMNIDNNILYISIYYKLINTDVASNFVYPYRLGTQDTYYTETY